MKTDLASLFPAAFALLHNSRFRNVGEAFHDNQTGETHPLKGLKMDAFSWEVVDWLVNWLHESSAHPGRPLRVPLVILEGPIQSGKSWLLQRLAEMAGCQGIGFHDQQFPPRESALERICTSGRALWVFDVPLILGRRGARQLERWNAFHNFLTSTSHVGRSRKGQAEFEHVLRTVVVLVVPGSVELSADLEQRAVRIRLRAREQAIVPAVKPPAASKTGVELIAEERARQISVEGWSSGHDDEHERGELARAGSVYADASICLADGVPPAVVRQQILDFAGCESPWPWHPSWLKLDANPVRALTKAGALIAAEIDRLQRRDSTAEAV